MAAIIWTDVTAIAPELSTYGATGQTIMLAYVNASVATNMFDGEGGPRTKLARVLLAAHLATATSRGDGGAGPVASESAGGLSVSYSNLSTQRLLGSTSYGILYLSIVDTSLARAPVVG